MSPKEHMERFARRVPGGGIAWESSVFGRSSHHDSVTLVDAAVDIAWENLLAQGPQGRYRLAINTQGRLLVFRLEGKPAPLLSSSTAAAIL